MAMLRISMLALVSLLGTISCSSHQEDPDAQLALTLVSDTDGPVNFKIERDGSKFSGQWESRGCSSLAPGKSCAVTVSNYTGTGYFLQKPLQVTFGPGNILKNNVSKCAPVDAENSNRCTFSIQNISSVHAPIFARLYVGRKSRALASFPVGGQLSGVNQLLGKKLPEVALNIAEGIFDEFSKDDICSMFGIGGSRPTEAQFNSLEQQVSAIEKSVDRILSQEAVAYNAIQNLEKLLAKGLAEQLNQFKTTSNTYYTQFNNALANSSACPPIYPSEDSIANGGENSQSKVYLTLLESALSCSCTSGGPCSCPVIDNLYNAASNAVGSPGDSGIVPGFGPNFASSLFSAINGLAVQHISTNVQSPGVAAQQNNRTLMLYAFKISNIVQHSYNVIHMMLYMSYQAPKSYGFNYLTFPVTGVLAANTYQQNLAALNTAYTNFSGQVKEALDANLMSDNPGSPGSLWSPGEGVESTMNQSPKLTALNSSTLSAAPAWVSNCNLYEWEGAGSLFVPPAVSVPKLSCTPPAHPATNNHGYSKTMLANSGAAAKCYQDSQSAISSLNYSLCSGSSSGVSVIQNGLPFLGCSSYSLGLVANAAMPQKVLLGQFEVSMPSGDSGFPSVQLFNFAAGQRGSLLLDNLSLDGVTYSNSVVVADVNSVVIQNSSKSASSYCSQGSGLSLNEFASGTTFARLPNYQPIPFALGVYAGACDGSHYTSATISLACVPNDPSCTINGSSLVTSSLTLQLDSSQNGTAASQVNLLISPTIATTYCAVSADCPVSKPICGSDKQCRTCQADTDCYPLGDTCSNGQCFCGRHLQACTDTICTRGYCSCGDFAGWCPAGQGCVVTQGNPLKSCVALSSCTSSSDCSGAAPACDTANKVCVQCLTNTDCSGGTAYCNVLNQCVQCLKDSDCPSKTPKCNQINACVAG